MTVAQTRQRNRVKGTTFEVLVRELLAKGGYLPMTADGIHIRRTDKHVRGRGCWHDVDALGRYAYPLFYMYPIRLLSEAKCYENDVNLPDIRNFVGALKDIAENYFVEDRMTWEEMIAYQRYTDCGSFFSATGFSLGAQKYALAQGVFLISYDNNPVLRGVVDSMYSVIDSLDILKASNEKNDFSEWLHLNLITELKALYVGKYIPIPRQTDFTAAFRQLKDRLDAIRTSVIAMIVGREPTIQYPVHLLSNQEVPVNLFAQRDDLFFRVHYTETRGGLAFDVEPTEALGFHLFFSLPKYVYSRYFSGRRMLDFKEKYLNHIELPVVSKGIRRILRLNLDQGWLEGQRYALRQRREV